MPFRGMKEHLDTFEIQYEPFQQYSYIEGGLYHQNL